MTGAFAVDCIDRSSTSITPGERVNGLDVLHHQYSIILVDVEVHLDFRLRTKAEHKADIAVSESIAEADHLDPREIAVAQGEGPLPCRTLDILLRLWCQPEVVGKTFELKVFVAEVCVDLPPIRARQPPE
jgi:hypothetical protein